MKKNMMNVVKGFLSGLTGGKRFAKGDALLLKDVAHAGGDGR